MVKVNIRYVEAVENWESKSDSQRHVWTKGKQHRFVGKDEDHRDRSGRGGGEEGTVSGASQGAELLGLGQDLM